MSVSNEQLAFEATAQRAEKLAREHPTRYRWQLLAYGLLGYFVIFGMLLSLIGIVAGLVFLAFKSTALLILLLKKKLIFLLIPVIWVLASALWVKLTAPEGYKAKREDFPELFSVIDALSKELKTAKIHDVILTPEFNAAIVQTPRLGIFGWYRNTLILGVELLLVLSPEQARAVIAHELGHLSGNHSRFAGWIYRVRQSWDRIMYEFSERDGFGAGLMSRFFHWYAPRFAAFSFALARQNEYEADRISAELTDAKTAGEALVNVHVRGPQVSQNYWQRFFKQADTSPEPPHLPWSGLVKWLGLTASQPQESAQGLEQAMENKTGYADTHPCLADRLRALGVRPALPAPSTSSAAQTWLGAKFGEVVSDFDKEWHQHNAAQWAQRHDYVQQSKRKLEQWQTTPHTDLDDSDLWDRACLTSEFGEQEEARAIFRLFQQRHPEDPNAALALGRMAWDDEGDELLQQMRIAIQSPSHVHEAYHYAYQFLAKHERLDEVEWWNERADRQAAMDAEANAERRELKVDDKLIMPTISDEQIASLTEQLAASGKVKAAWLAQKQVKHYKDVPALAIAVAGKGFMLDENSLADAVMEHLELDCTFYVVPKMGDHKKLAKRIAKAGIQIVG